MTQTQGPVVQVKPQPNIYTVLLMVAVVVLVFATVVVCYDLMTTYGMSFGDIFSGQVTGPK